MDKPYVEFVSEALEYKDRDSNIVAILRQMFEDAGRQFAIEPNDSTAQAVTLALVLFRDYVTLGIDPLLQVTQDGFTSARFDVGSK